jgi:hypothetical protein
MNLREFSVGELMDRLPNEAREDWRAGEGVVARLATHWYASDDSYDIWGTGYRFVIRRLYYEKSLAKLPLIATILALEVLCAQGWALEKVWRHCSVPLQLVVTRQSRRRHEAYR